MKKLVVIGAVAFVVSIGIAVGARMFIFPPKSDEPVAADSTGVAVEHVTANAQEPDHAGDEPAAEPESHTPATELPGGTAALKAMDAEKTKPESETVKPAQTHSEPESVPDSTDLASVEESPAAAPPEEQETPPVIDRPVETAQATRPDGSQYKTLAKILATMKTADAVKILAHLDDDQVEGILRSMQVRQIATLLAKLPTERAAALGQRLVDPTQGEDS